MTPKCFIIKWFNSGKEENLKGGQRKKTYYRQRRKVKNDTDFLSETM